MFAVTFLGCVTLSTGSAQQQESHRANGSSFGITEQKTVASAPGNAKIPVAPPGAPQIESIDGNQVRVGLATIDRSARCVRFPATSTSVSGRVGCAVAFAQAGGADAHFVTSTTPRDIHIASLLLGAKPSSDQPTPFHVTVEVEWNDGQSLRKAPLGSLVSGNVESTPHSDPKAVAGNDPWIYQGSAFDDAGFAANRTGRIIALDGDPSALVCGKRSSVSPGIEPPKVGTVVTIAIHYPPPTPGSTSNSLEIPVDWLDQLTANGKTIHFTLPNGTIVGGSIETLERTDGTVRHLAGRINHPEPGEFDFKRSTSDSPLPELSGTLNLSSQAIEWVVAPSPGQPGRFMMVRKPLSDGFRPRNQKLPNRAGRLAETPESLRAKGEERLRKSSQAVAISPGRVRFGTVDVWKDVGCIRIPVSLAEREKVIEYVVVTATGKVHESLLTTPADPGDVYLGLLELGLVPTPCGNPGRELEIQPASAVQLDLEWSQSPARPLTELIGIKLPEAAAEPMPRRPWHFNGSKFSSSAFAAMLEGSLISLVPDDLALLNNSGPDRNNDDSHFPATSELPPKGTHGTLIISLPLPASKPKPKPTTINP